MGTKGRIVSSHQYSKWPLWEFVLPFPWLCRNRIQDLYQDNTSASGKDSNGLKLYYCLFILILNAFEPLDNTKSYCMGNWWERLFLITYDRDATGWGQEEYIWYPRECLGASTPSHDSVQVIVVTMVKPQCSNCEGLDFSWRSILSH